LIYCMSDILHYWNIAPLWVIRLLLVLLQMKWLNYISPTPPVIPLEQRIEMLLALSCVDIVIPYHELDYLSVCKKVKADIFVIGEDWGRKPHNQDVENYFNIKGKKVVQIKYSPKNSSTQIKKDVIAQFQRN